MSEGLSEIMPIPRRKGFDYWPGGIGLGLSFSWAGTWYEDYSYTRKVKYLDIRLSLLFWILWIQIPYKKYGISGIVPKMRED